MQIREQGQQEDAVRICMEVLEKSRRILGDNHPNTITAMGNLEKGVHGRMADGAFVEAPRPRHALGGTGCRREPRPERRVIRSTPRG